MRAQRPRHAECRAVGCGEPLESEQRVGRQDERPDFMKVGIGEPKGLEHWGNISCRIADVACGVQGIVERAATTETLPECCLGVDVGEQRSGDQGENGVEVGPGVLRLDAWSNVELVDGEPGYRGLVDRPKRGLSLVELGEALGSAGEAFGHAKREAKIDGEGKSHAGGEQRAGKRIEDCGVDQAGVRRQIVAGDCEVGGVVRTALASALSADELSEPDSGSSMRMARAFVSLRRVGKH
jgi:hypothetical protein